MSVVCLSDSLTRRHVALVILLFSQLPLPDHPTTKNLMLTTVHY